MGDIRIRRFRFPGMLQWLSSGWRLLRRRPLEGLRPAAVFAFVALLLLNVPVVGDVSLLLLLPLFLASYLLHIHLITNTASRIPAGEKRAEAWRRWGRELQHALFGACAKPVNLLSLIVLGVAMVILGVATAVLFRMVGGQAVVNATAVGQLTVMQMGQVLLAYGVVTLLWALIAAMTLWSLPMLILRDMELSEALRWGLRGFRHNAGAAIAFPLLFAASLTPGLLVKPWLPLAHHVVQWLLLASLSVLFGFGAYCSYRLVFAEAARAATPRPPSAHKPPPAPGNIPKPGPHAR